MRSRLDIFLATSPVSREYCGQREKENRENNIWRLKRKQSRGEVRVYNYTLSRKFINVSKMRYTLIHAYKMETALKIESKSLSNRDKVPTR